MNKWSKETSINHIKGDYNEYYQLENKIKERLKS